MERPENYNCYDHEKEFIEMVKSGVIEKLNDYKGETKNPGDLGYDLTECENVNGSWYCSTWKAEQDLSWFFSVFEKYQEWWMSNYGDQLEMFSKDGYFEPERVHCCMMIDAYRNTFERVFASLCDEDENYDWDNEFEINEEFIHKMKKIMDENFFEIEDIF